MARARRLGPGKELGEVLLIIFEDVDAKEAVLFQHGEQVGAFIHADGNQGWNKRDGGEGVGGHAVDTSWGAFNSDYRDAGGEMT